MIFNSWERTVLNCAIFFVALNGKFGGYWDCDKEGLQLTGAEQRLSAQFERSVAPPPGGELREHLAHLSTALIRAAEQIIRAVRPRTASKLASPIPGRSTRRWAPGKPD
jgi:hypothetical protein